MLPPSQAPSATSIPLAELLGLSSRARLAETPAELNFLLLNETRALAPYRQSALWDVQTGALSLSGLVQADANVPYAQWVREVMRHLTHTQAQACTFGPSDLPPKLRDDWAEWWPSNALWIPATSQEHTHTQFGSVWLADQPWREVDVTLLTEWLQIWAHAANALIAHQRPRHAWLKPKSGRWLRTRRAQLAAGGAVLLLMLAPVHLSVLAPGELVPTHPVDLRAPLDGVIGEVLVQPNDTVKANQVLWTFDRALLANRLTVAQQALATAFSAYRQTSQKALGDPQVREQLSQLQGQIRERQAQVDYLTEQVQRAEVLAPQAGMALFDDAASLVGKPVQIGERVMRIAAPGDVEVEGWLSLGDAIELDAGAPAKLYLNARPLSPVAARLRYVSHEASLRPDGQYAYRVRATLVEPSGDTVGLKGTLKLEGHRVPAIYWVLRRPLAQLRTTLGW